MGCCILVHALCKGLALFTKMPRAKESYPRDVSGGESALSSLCLPLPGISVASHAFDIMKLPASKLQSTDTSHYVFVRNIRLLHVELVVKTR